MYRSANRPVREPPAIGRYRRLGWVDFPRWEEGDTTGWLSRAERYFCYHRTPEASLVDIAVIHLEGDAI
ncbi:hypothetical protein BHM03_00029311 [Ensete ventricosum]|nr:hypothetical protein BHM03_00029311 [Ensete ventricosum]